MRVPWAEEPHRTLASCRLNLERAQDRINAFYFARAPGGETVCIDEEMEAYVGLEIHLIHELVCAQMPEFIVTMSRPAWQQEVIDQILCPERRLAYDQFFPRKPAIRRVPKAMRLPPAELASPDAAEETEMRAQSYILQLADVLVAHGMTMTLGVLAKHLDQNGIEIGGESDETEAAAELVKATWHWARRDLCAPGRARNLWKSFVTEKGRRLPFRRRDPK